MIYPRPRPTARNGQPFTHIVRRRAMCLACGELRVAERHVNRLGCATRPGGDRYAYRAQ